MRTPPTPAPAAPKDISPEEQRVIDTLNSGGEHFGLIAQRVSSGVLMISTWNATRETLTRLYVLDIFAQVPDLHEHHRKVSLVQRDLWQLEGYSEDDIASMLDWNVAVGVVRIEFDGSITPVYADVHEGITVAA
jgi:hypothetical protein